MFGAAFDKAIKAWRDTVGAEHVSEDPAVLEEYTANVSNLRRSIVAVVCPGSTKEVQAVVRIANECKTPLYPISCGKNWGMGSRLPPKDGAAVVDLGRMKKIHEVDVTHHYAVLEPGVTQGHLYDYIREKDLPLMLNCTGAPRDTSLIGNALERGVGYLAGRAESLSGMEVVLGNGEILETGCAHFPGSVTTHANKHGIGPGLDQVFFQSNFGIVTRACVELMPKHEAHIAMVCKVREESGLVDLVDRLAELRRVGVIRSAVHVAGRERSSISVCPVIYDYLRGKGWEADRARRTAAAWFEGEGFGAWSAVGGLMGTRAQVRDAKRRVSEAMKGLGKATFISDALVAGAKKAASLLGFVPFVKRKEALLYCVEPFYELTKGVPTDAALPSVYWPVIDDVPPGVQNPDQSRCGLLYVLPMIPMSGRDAQDLVDRTKRVFGEGGFTPYITFNMVGTRALESVINLAFDREDPEQSEKAHACVRRLQEECLSAGLIPYRSGIQTMDTILDDKDVFWRTVRDLKQVFDPNHIIAPGRYNLV